MMMRLLAAVVVVTGAWALNFVDRDGTHTQGYCTFTQTDEKLSGECGAERTGGMPLTGEIHGQEVTWRVRGGASFKAILDEHGDFMNGSFSERSDGIFTGTRTK